MCSLSLPPPTLFLWMRMEGNHGIIIIDHYQRQTPVWTHAPADQQGGSRTLHTCGPSVTVWPASHELINCSISICIDIYCSLPARCGAQGFTPSVWTTTLQSTVPQVPTFLCLAATAREATRYIRHFTLSVLSFSVAPVHILSPVTISQPLFAQWEMYLEMSSLSAHP